MEFASENNPHKLNYVTKNYIDGMPLMMKLSISGKVQKHQGSYGGTYFLQEDKTNDRYYWIHQSGEKAIWWDTSSKPYCWIIGKFEDLGNYMFGIAGIRGPLTYDSPPNQITNGWMYFVNTYWQSTNRVCEAI